MYPTALIYIATDISICHQFLSVSLLVNVFKPRHVKLQGQQEGLMLFSS